MGGLGSLPVCCFRLPSRNLFLSHFGGTRVGFVSRHRLALRRHARARNEHRLGDQHFSLWRERREPWQVGHKRRLAGVHRYDRDHLKCMGCWLGGVERAIESRPAKNAVWQRSARRRSVCHRAGEGRLVENSACITTCTLCQHGVFESGAEA